MQTGEVFPEGNTLSDVVLLTNQLIQKKSNRGKDYRSTGRTDLYSKGSFFVQLWKNARKNRRRFNKTYREMNVCRVYREVERYMEELMLIEIRADHVKIRPAAGKIYGKYPEDFLKNGGRDE